MKILTIRGQQSAGKSTFLSIGAAGLLKLDVAKFSRQEKTRVLLVAESRENMRHLARLFDTATQGVGIIGCSTGEHGCFVQHQLVLDRDTSHERLSMRYDYVVADHPSWPELFSWARRNVGNIRHLIASEWAGSKDESLLHLEQQEELQNVAA